MRSIIVVVILTLAALSTFTATSHAEFIVAVQQIGGNVVAVGSGTINLSSLTNFGTINRSPGVQARSALLDAGDWSSGSSFPVYTGLSGPPSFGPGDRYNASAASGDPVAILGRAMLVPPIGYVSGVSLSNTTTWNNTTISGLGLTPGTYTWTWGSGATADFLAVQIDVVPEPSILVALLSLALCGVGVGWYRRPKPQ